MFGFIREYQQIKPLLENRFDVIFYVENAGYFQYLKYIIEELQEKKLTLAYISSDKLDPQLDHLRPSIQTFYSKSTLAFLFPKLRARFMVMTMPDLDNFILKRSSSVEEYVYVFHALVSTHQQYRKCAFNKYDTIFCTSTQQIEEIRQTEKLHHLPHKKLIEFGYPLLDDVKDAGLDESSSPFTILIAPGWSKNGIFETCLPELLQALAGTKYQISLRPHPEYIKRYRKRWGSIKQMIKSASNITIDEKTSVPASLLKADYLITDRSGIAFEFALARQKPVLFIDTDAKITNPDYQQIDIQPIEDRYRDAIGKRIALSGVVNIIREIETLDEFRFAKQINEVRSKVVFDSSYHTRGIQYLESGFAG